MAIVSATGTWASVTTVEAEYWQVKEGMIEISDAEAEGLILTSDESLPTTIRIAADRDVHYRAVNGSSAKFARVAVA